MISNFKPTTIRSPKYIKLVASLPCILCGISNCSQAAHIHLYGQKSTGRKVSDNQVVPLCCERGNNCHWRVDNYKLKPDRDKLVKSSKAAYEYFLEGDIANVRIVLSNEIYNL
jgi:hypothetical protein